MSNKRLLVDGYGRRVKTLRISLTDRCNFRCIYCLPPEGVSLLPKSKHLTLAEIARLARVVGQMGVFRFRLTGGEPLLRGDIIDIVKALKQIDAVSELSVTTNGSLLSRLAQPLKEAGLDRVNMSLDSLDAKRFERVTGGTNYRRVREGLDAALREGFPVKVNVVVMAGITNAEIIEYARLAAARTIEIRFLEFMPLCGAGWRPDLVYPVERVRKVIEDHFDLTELPRNDQPARSYQVSGGAGKIGFIEPLSKPFCESCSRMRITADGKLRPCLFSDYEVPIREYLKDGAPEELLVQAIKQAVLNKPKGSQFVEHPYEENADDERRVSMGPLIRNIGG